MKTNNGNDINGNQCIDIVARMFIFKNQIQWIVVARRKKISDTAYEILNKNQHAILIFLKSCVGRKEESAHAIFNPLKELLGYVTELTVQ